MMISSGGLTHLAEAKRVPVQMLESGPAFGVRKEGRLVCAGGVHVFSRDYGVAAIGNVATAPPARRRGLGRAVTAALCHALAGAKDLGLNVEVGNRSAVACYEGLGFQAVCRYVEGLMTRR